MCIAIYKPLNVDIPSEEILRKCFLANSDGAGFGYFHKGEMIINKGFFKFRDFYEALKAVPNPKSKKMFIHCRIGTSGGIRKEMCHPFKVHNNVMLMHNGVLSSGTKNKSDTAIIADELSKFADPVEALSIINQMMLLKNNRLAIMSDEKLVLMGDWTDHVGCKFSNMSWQYYGVYNDDCYGYSYWNQNRIGFQGNQKKSKKKEKTAPRRGGWFGLWSQDDKQKQADKEFVNYINGK